MSGVVNLSVSELEVCGKIKKTTTYDVRYQLDMVFSLEFTLALQEFAFGALIKKCTRTQQQ